MESMFAEMPLALFTTFSSIGAGSFVALAAVAFAAKLDDTGAAKLDRLSIIPFLVACVGFACAFFHLATPLNAFGVFSGVGSSPLSNEIVAGVVFMVAAAVYVALALAGKLSGGLRRVLLVVCAVLAVVFSLFMGAAYMMFTIPSWNTWATPAQMLGFALLGGAMLVGVLVAASDVRDAVLASGAKRALLALGGAGALLAVAALAVFLTSANALPSVWADTSALVPSVLPYAVAAAVLLVLGAMLLAGVLAKKPAVLLSGAGVASVAVGILVARLAFYAVQISAGI
ncbi:DmsC/YnfH family molybdoenzyme membrane anchor subunit [Senegalimassilia anaerobia]|uniref:dimethyl sulfoxide reductase anchor subunit family protein n=1 Tax=Senegalimassilia anaerobia TaxID=1473216 RepID=UPI0026EFEE07|nr:DmsC/YnfH family molybdoenzyme membrane anchor subunit [Senegalimassilia anaerobia]